MPAIAAAEFACAECGAVAGRVEIVPSPTHPGNRLVVSIFTSSWEEASPDATYAAAAEAITRRDALALWEMDLEWAPFYCPACNRCYCRDHWTMQVEFDDGFYDCTRGTCPRGHTRLLDD